MAKITITNLTNSRVNVQELYIEIDGGASHTISRNLPDLERMPQFMELFDNGTIGVVAEIEPWELTWRRFVDTTETARSWSFQTNSAIQYAGGYYDMFSGSDTFSPQVQFGVPSSGKAAHVFVVTGAQTVDDLTIRVSGTRIQDDGTQTPAYSEDITIPLGTPANAYFEFHKFNGQVTIESISGTPVPCNYGWSKYHDFNNQDFELLGLECVWESDASDPGSDIKLIHHKSTGWTYNLASEPTPPAPVALRSADHLGNNSQSVGPGAWKRSDLSTRVNGSGNEGIMFCVQSGSTGVGSLSFRVMTMEVTIRKLPSLS